MKYIKHFEKINYNKTSLNYHNKKLTKLPKLPDTLEYLDCSSNFLKELPTLPNSIISIYCGDNNLTELPKLPDTLKYLMCDDNQLSELPILPITVTYLHCTGNELPYNDLEGYNYWLEINHPDVFMTRKFNI